MCSPPEMSSEQSALSVGERTILGGDWAITLKPAGQVLRGPTGLSASWHSGLQHHYLGKGFVPLQLRQKAVPSPPFLAIAKWENFLIAPPCLLTLPFAGEQLRR